MTGTRAFQELLLRGGRYRIDFDALFQMAPIGLAILDSELRYVRCNDRLAEINGIAVEDHIGCTVGELLRGLASEVLQAFLEVFSSGRPSDELSVVWTSPSMPSSRRWFLENARPLIDEEGTVRHILVSVQEVTALEEIRESLAQSESTFRASQQLSPDGFAILRAMRDRSGQVSDFKFEYANPAAKALVGVGRLTGRWLRQLLKSQKGAEARFNWYVDVLRSVGVEEREFEYSNQGRSTWVRASCIAVNDERIAVAFHDMSEARLAEQRLRLITREYRHRLKNMIAVASALVVQGAKDATDVGSFSEALLQRLSAMAAAQDILAGEERGPLTIGMVVRAALKPFSDSRLEVSAGPDLPFDADCVVPLTLVLNELATNAAKYGALSAPKGIVALSWTVEAGRIEIIWSERGGPSVTPPEREGFGSKLLARVTRSLPKGRYSPEFAVDGFRASLGFDLR